MNTLNVFLGYDVVGMVILVIFGDLWVLFGGIVVELLLVLCRVVTGANM